MSCTFKTEIVVLFLLWESEIQKCGFMIKLIKKFNKLHFRTLELLSPFL